ncbi:hypothetical protein RchiOBHm_Chr3g0475711 [Rosa chinensis]|uniref:Late embryogenesis abundant protein, LEA-14 n=1 Tax=Rosa chinensis TaxID=74649 RepID=A0A2P6RCI1_ROSCH|nr:NDR1/HIN1-like protein 26 [Rosa chinensis]PRQ44120.1 hypothetical protein RchiOBHm_Chr3g0475711 [Rosa chinensis]
MATIQDDKTVTGYPVQPGQVPTGYRSAPPYPFPPPPPEFHYNPQPAGPNKPTSFARVLMGFFAVSAVIILITFLNWLVMHPKLPEFKVESATVSLLNVTRSELTATWDISLLSTNPNKKLRINYDHVEASIVYGDHNHIRLGRTPLRPFVVNHRNQTRIDMKLGAVSEWVGDDVANEISDDRSRGLVTFGVRLMTSVRFKCGLWLSKSRLLLVTCDRVDLGLSPNNGTGTLTGLSRECGVHFYSLF